MKLCEAAGSLAPMATLRCRCRVAAEAARPATRIGSALVQAAAEHATRLGSLHVTVHSGRKAVPVYERLGFESSRQLLQRLPD